MLKQMIRKILHRVRGETNVERLKKQGLKIGRRCNILPGVIIDPSHAWHIVIGDDVILAPRVHILAHDASMKSHLGYTRIGKVSIGNRVFIGAGSIILPGVSIGDNSVIGAGSVVTKNIPSDVVAAGNPARVLFPLEEYLSRLREHMKTYPCFGEEYTARGGVSREMKEEMNERMGAGIGFII